jgi:hypothetical protein
VTLDLQLRQLLLPKLGQEASECEDVIAVDAERYRFAVADGATEAFAARRWAERLAQQWVRRESTLTSEEFRDWVAAEGRELHESWNGLSLSWYAEAKARTGSFAAFVGVELDLKSVLPSWKAVALGDTCLLHRRGDVLVKSLPLARSDCFNNAPILVASNCALHETSMKSVLMSDAVASWYLKCFENDDLAAEDCFFTRPDNELGEFFDQERRAGRIRNDDLAIVRIEFKERSMG